METRNRSAHGRRGPVTRWRALGALLLTGMLAAGSLAAASAAQVSPADEHRASFTQSGFGIDVLTVAHLGAWRDAPEDSIPSIEQAGALGVEIVEIDLQRTSDGQLVVMHDGDVSRTTNGTGAVSGKTVAQMQALLLRELRGGSTALLTDEHVPTFAEAMAAAGDDVLLNVDKAWAYREQVWAEAAAAGKTEYIVFKSDAGTSDVNAFLTAHPDALYCQVITDDNYAVAHTFVREPDCYEVVWDSPKDAQVQMSYLAELQSVSRVWMNTLWRGLSGDYTDESSLRDRGDWGEVVALGASIIQTDHPAALRHWIEGGRASNYGLGGAESVRVQAEDYDVGGQGVAYNDGEASNQGGQYRPDEGVDVCDLQGNIHVCWIRAGEWISYSVTLPVDGTYQISARVSSPYRPAGSLTLDFGGWSTAAVGVRTTTSHTHFLDQTIDDGRVFTAGTYQFTMRATSGVFQNFNVDYWQFELLSSVATGGTG